MPKKRSKKNNPSKKISSQSKAFQNLEEEVKSTNTKVQSNGIPKYVADRMAKRIFFTAGIPTLLGMSVFVISISLLLGKWQKYLLLLQLLFQHYSSY